MTCAEIGAQLAAYHEGGLRLSQRHVVALHLTSCPRCAAELAAYDAGAKALRQFFVQTPSATIYESVVQRLSLEDVASQQRKARLLHSVTAWFNVAGTVGATGVVGIVLVVLAQSLIAGRWATSAPQAGTTGQAGSSTLPHLVSAQQSTAYLSPAAGSTLTRSTTNNAANVVMNVNLLYVHTNDPTEFDEGNSEAPIMSVRLIDGTVRTRTLVPTPGIYSAVAVSPDGRKMAYGVHSSVLKSDQRGIWIRDAEAQTPGTRIRVPHDQPSVQIKDIHWATNDKDLIFSVQTTSSVMLYVDDITDLHHPRVIWSYHGWWPANNEALSPNLNLLATAGHQGGPRIDQALQIHNLRSGKTVTVGIGADPVWSPDSSTLAYLTGRSSSSETLMIVDARGGSPRRLTAMPQDIRSIAWSPDGRAIAYTTHEGGTSSSAQSCLWIVPIDRPDAATPGLRTRWIGDFVWLPPTSRMMH